MLIKQRRIHIPGTDYGVSDTQIVYNIGVPSRAIPGTIAVDYIAFSTQKEVEDYLLKNYSQTKTVQLVHKNGSGVEL